MFATHSKHKLLAALSQASWIHIQKGRGALEDALFNEVSFGVSGYRAHEGVLTLCPSLLTHRPT